MFNKAQNIKDKYLREAMWPSIFCTGQHPVLQYINGESKSPQRCHGTDQQTALGQTTAGDREVDDQRADACGPAGVDDAGVTHNVNADEAAGAIAGALAAEKLILLTDVEGVRDARGKLIPQLSVEEARKRMAEGAIREGMIPKVECCLEALQQGVRSTHVIDGRVLHAVLLEIFTDGGVGTLLTR